MNYIEKIITYENDYQYDYECRKHIAYGWVCVKEGLTMSIWRKYDNTGEVTTQNSNAKGE